MKRKARIAALLGASILLAALVLRLVVSTPSPVRDLGAELQRIVDEEADQSGPVRNCVVSVTSGDGSVAWSGAAGIAGKAGSVPMTKNAPIYVASVTKLYTAVVAMLLVERGTLTLDEPMAKFLPPPLMAGIHVYDGKDYSGAITIAELLAHRSGIADYYSEKAADGKTLFDLLVEDPERPWTVDEAVARVRDKMKPNFPPGTDTSYSDTNFQLLGRVIETATGKPLDAVYEDLLFRPLGLEHTWLLGHPRAGSASSAAVAEVFRGNVDITKVRSSAVYWADGGIVSTAEEMIVFLRALHDGRILRADTLESMHHWHKMRFPLQYGYGTMYFSLPPLPSRLSGLPPLWGHSGSTGSFLYYAENLDLYVAGTIDQTEGQIKPFLLMSKVLKAVKAREGDGAARARAGAAGQR